MLANCVLDVGAYPDLRLEGDGAQVGDKFPRHVLLCCCGGLTELDGVLVVVVVVVFHVGDFGWRWLPLTGGLWFLFACSRQICCCLVEK